MPQQFIPKGHLYFEDACFLAANLKFGDEWEPPSIEELGQIAILSQGAGIAGGAAAPRLAAGLATRVAKATERHQRTAEQLRQARGDVRQCLFGGELDSWILSESGRLLPIPERVWGTGAFDEIVETGELQMEVPDSYIMEWTSGPVMLLTAQIQEQFGKSSSPATEKIVPGSISQVQSDLTLTTPVGRPKKFDWDAIWAEICRIVHFDGVPETQAELVSRVQSWCQSELGAAPETSTLKPKVRSLFKKLNRDEN